MISIEVDGKSAEVPEGCSVKEALQILGFEITMFPSTEALFMPCQTGGCGSCALDIDGQLTPACISKVHQGMKIKTDASSLTPRRVVGGFMAHKVGGVGTPWWIKSEGGFIEVACFTSGCNFCCPQCQNWRFAYLNPGDPLTPGEAARLMTATKRRYGVSRIAVSGGECTLNRPWLVQYLRLLKEQNPESHLHVDTNGSILTKDYLEDLIQVGMTDLGLDLKAIRASTFQEITGLVDEELALKYMETAWQAARYLHDTHPEVFLGIGIPYNQELIGIDEIRAMGEKIAEIDPWIQVSALDYRPEFRRPDLVKPSFWDMMQVHAVLRDCGLESVICQTERGKIGPTGRLLM